ncbi:MAG: hypothetical protein AAGH41_06165 [Pseudomonadota bacterium]
MFKQTFAVIGAAFLATSASAATLDFTEITMGTQTVVTGPSQNLSNAALSTTGAQLAFTEMFGANGAFCGLTQTGSTDCSTVTEILFDVPVDSLSFSTYATNGGDTLTATIFDAAGTQLGQLTTPTVDTTVFFGPISGIARLVLDQTASLAGNGGGSLVGDFNFSTGNAVPVPAAALLFAPAILALRRKKG